MRIRRDGEATRRRLLEAASAVFGEFGYDRSTHTTIAERAGVNAALIGFHFGSKDGLYRAVWSELVRQVSLYWPIDGGLPADAPAEDRLRAHIEASLHRVCDDRLSSFHQLRMKETVNPTGLLDEEVAAHHAENRGHMVSVLRDLLGPCATDSDVALCELSIINQLRVLRPHHRHRHHPSPFPRFGSSDVPRLTDHITTFSLAGVSAVRREIEAREEASA